MATAARSPLIAGNWKMTPNHLEGLALVQKIAFTLPARYFDAVEVAVIPPFTAIRSVQTLIEGDKLSMAYGAQDISQHDSGAYTGEISGGMLRKLGCTYAVIGHSERREYHQETDDIVQAKVAAAFRHDLVPILCVGEGLDVRDANNHVQHVTGQLIAGMRGVPAEQAAKIVIAYEPVWAIGTGRTATPAHAQEVCTELRQLLAGQYGQELADGVRILYGGSVRAANVADIMAEPDVDGALVGGASVDGAEFAQLVANAVGILP